MAAAVCEAVVVVVFLLFAAFPGTLSEPSTVQVNASVNVIQGENVSLKCVLQSAESVSQVTWSCRRAGQASSVHVATKSQMFGSVVALPFRDRVTFSSTDPRAVSDGSLSLSAVSLADEGTFSCDFTLFPSGSITGETKLVVMVRPVVSLVAGSDPLVAGGSPLVAGLCRATNGKPAAVVTWAGFGQGAAPVVTETENADQSVSVESRLTVSPSRELDGARLVCSVAHPALPHPETRTLTLSVLFAPEVRVVGYDGNWWVGRRGVSLVCQTAANPPAHIYSWKWGNESVSILGLDPGNSTLNFPILSAALAGEFSCTAQNIIGSTCATLPVAITDPPTTVQSGTSPIIPPYGSKNSGQSDRNGIPGGLAPGPQGNPHANTGALIGGVLGGILALLLVSLAAFFGRSAFRRWRKSRFRGDYDAKKFHSSEIPAGNSSPARQSPAFPDKSASVGVRSGTPSRTIPGTPPPRYANETLPLAPFRPELSPGADDPPDFWGAPAGSESRYDPGGRRVEDRDRDHDDYENDCLGEMAFDGGVPPGMPQGGCGVPDGTARGFLGGGNAPREFLMPVEHDLIPQRDGSLISKKEWYV